jgi:outer membrane protein OmpA-like peptidoglycan-associated protein
MNTRFLLLATVTAALAACASVPDRNPALEQARTGYQSAQRESNINLYAADELKQAGAALQLAEKSYAGRESAAEVNHLAYLTGQRTAIARETASSRAAQDVTAGAAVERDRMLLALRTQEADTASRQLAASEQASTRKSAELAQADAQAAGDRVRLARSDARVDSLEQQLAALDVRRTERGIVVTLGDMLFDSGQSRLQASGTQSLAKLADFMNRNPQRRAAIDGHTDNIGSAASNQDLSDRRAQSVRTALVGMGVGAERLSSRGHGEDDPVADNDTAAGRQMNRRVEVVFAPEAGDILTRQP